MERSIETLVIVATKYKLIPTRLDWSNQDIYHRPDEDTYFRPREVAKNECRKLAAMKIADILSKHPEKTVDRTRMKIDFYMGGLKEAGCKIENITYDMEKEGNIVIFIYFHTPA